MFTRYVKIMQKQISSMSKCKLFQKSYLNEYWTFYEYFLYIIFDEKEIPNRLC